MAEFTVKKPCTDTFEESPAWICRGAEGAVSPKEVLVQPSPIQTINRREHFFAMLSSQAGLTLWERKSHVSTGSLQRGFQVWAELISWGART